VFAWFSRLLDRLAAWLYRRGQEVVESVNREREARAGAVRDVIEALGEAMMQADYDRQHGAGDAERAAITAAARAASMVHEVDDEEARRLVAEWKARFDSIPKGWMQPQQYSSRPPGYPESAWGELREAARQGEERPRNGSAWLRADR
jgi:hypothetical protein